MKLSSSSQTSDASLSLSPQLVPLPLLTLFNYCAHHWSHGHVSSAHGACFLSPLKPHHINSVSLDKSLIYNIIQSRATDVHERRLTDCFKLRPLKPFSLSLCVSWCFRFICNRNQHVLFLLLKRLFFLRRDTCNVSRDCSRVSSVHCMPFILYTRFTFSSCFESNFMMLTHPLVDVSEKAYKCHSFITAIFDGRKREKLEKHFQSSLCLRVCANVYKHCWKRYSKRLLSFNTRVHFYWNWSVTCQSGRDDSREQCSRTKRLPLFPSSRSAALTVSREHLQLESWLTCCFLSLR